MPIVAVGLANAIRSQLIANLSDFNAPFDRPQSLIFCNAIASGVANSTNGQPFTTADTGVRASSPVPGVGLGRGIFGNKDWLIENMYKNIRQESGALAASFNSRTLNPSWPPPSSNVLFKMCQAIGTAVTNSLENEVILNSTHPLIYAGTGLVNNYPTITPSFVAGNIQSAASSFSGQFWPNFCQAVGKAYSDYIKTQTTATVTITGTCVPSTSQTCNISSSGSGSGFLN
jgi:hypothetical protein